MGDEHAAPSAELDPFLGRTIEGKYLVEELLGWGAMGSVYRARQVALDRSVALKVMSPTLANDPSFVDRFHREARMASRLWHPNSVSVTDFGEAADGLLYLVMELVPGRNLDELIQREYPLGDARIVSILAQVLSAVAAAHDLGIVHRDLKPENLLVVQGVDDDGAPRDTVKVCDFGLARGLGVDVEELRSTIGTAPAGPNVTTVGVVLGTPAYMSPEQAAGLAPEKRSDLYAVGAILFELLTKEVPFERATVQETVLAHLSDPPPDPRELAPGCNPALAALCLRALAKAPEDRPPTARAMRAALQRALASPGGSEAVAALDDPRAPESVYPSVPGVRSAPLVRTEADATATLAAGTPAPPSSRPAARRRAPLLAGVGALALAGIVYAGVRSTSRTHASDASRAVMVAASGEPAAPPSVPALPPGSAVANAVPARVPGPIGSAPASSPSSLLPGSGPSTRRTATSAAPAAAAAAGAMDRAAVPPAVLDTAPAAATIADAPAPAPALVADAVPIIAAPAPSYDPGRAAAVLTVADVTGTSRKTVAALVAHVTVTDCYQNALRPLGRPEGGQGSMHLDIDEDGVITAVAVKLPPVLAGAAGCFRTRLLRQRLGRPPDTGSASSELSIQLSP